MLRLQRHFWPNQVLHSQDSTVRLGQVLEHEKEGSKNSETERVKESDTFSEF